jgi:glycosyltransferase involved in cell wall biosynthesis
MSASSAPAPVLTAEAVDAATPGARPARDPARPPSISAVVPMHDEAETAARLLNALRNVLATLTDRFEIVVVNDGSRDGTRGAVLEAGEACCVHYVELSRNFGKEAALTAGLEAARGDVVVMLDADFQHPLELIPAMLGRWYSGADAVYGVRRDRKDESLVKRSGAGVLGRILSSGAGVEIPRNAGDFRLMDRKVVDALIRLPERSRFMKGLYAWVGFHAEPIEFEVAPRAGGTSSFSFSRLAGLATAGITGFTYLPLRAISALGCVISLFALGYAVYVVIETLLLGNSVRGYPTIVVSIMLFSGVQLLSLGVVGEYLARVYEEVKRRPLYLVGDAVDFSGLPPVRR